MFSYFEERRGWRAASPAKTPYGATLGAHDNAYRSLVRGKANHSEDAKIRAEMSTAPQPPESELQFDVGSTDDSLERMMELFATLGDTYRVYAPGRKS